MRLPLKPNRLCQLKDTRLPVLMAHAHSRAFVVEKDQQDPQNHRGVIEEGNCHLQNLGWNVRDANLNVVRDPLHNI